jgi:RNA polymerase sigma factor (sigma-70 family)
VDRDYFENINKKPLAEEEEKRRVSEIDTLSFAYDILVLMNEPGQNFLKKCDKDLTKDLELIKNYVFNSTKYNPNVTTLTDTEIHKNIKDIRIFCKKIALKYKTSKPLFKDAEACLAFISIPPGLKEFVKKWRFRKECYQDIISELKEKLKKMPDDHTKCILEDMETLKTIKKDLTDKFLIHYMYLIKNAFERTDISYDYFNEQTQYGSEELTNSLKKFDIQSSTSFSIYATNNIKNYMILKYNQDIKYANKTYTFDPNVQKDVNKIIRARTKLKLKDVYTTESIAALSKETSLKPEKVKDCLKMIVSNKDLVSLYDQISDSEEDASITFADIAADPGKSQEEIVINTEMLAILNKTFEEFKLNEKNKLHAQIIELKFFQKKSNKIIASHISSAEKQDHPISDSAVSQRITSAFKNFIMFFFEQNPDLDDSNNQTLDLDQKVVLLRYLSREDTPDDNSPKKKK